MTFQGGQNCEDPELFGILADIMLCSEAPTESGPPHLPTNLGMVLTLGSQDYNIAGRARISLHPYALLISHSRSST